MTDNKCEVCDEIAVKKCGGCHLVYYCSVEHQKLGWKTHKKMCKKPPYEICQDENLGRFLIATRPIKEDEIILKENPLIWGPSQFTHPICLGCGGKLNSKRFKECSKCGWPMCSDICENSPSHIPECSYTVNRGDKISITNFDIPHPMYTSILALRCYYVKQYIQEKWAKLDKLESHDEERKKIGNYETDKTNIAMLIKRFYKIQQFDEDEVLRICGIINVNAHEVPLSEPSYVAIYDKVSFIEHNCRANCCKSFTSEGEILIIAGRPIEKGEHLSICYTDPLWGTLNRRHHLYQTKYFWCSCERCADVTEFKTYFDAFKCQKSKCNGYMLPKSFLTSENVNDLNSKWRCLECNADLYTHTIETTLQKIGQQLNELPKGSVDDCKMFLKTNENYLHGNHHYIVDIKLALVQLLGQRFKRGVPDITEEDLLLKIKYCRQLIELSNKLVPAERRVRGLLYFELHSALAEIGRRRSSETSIDDVHLSLTESRSYLIECIRLLKEEPIELPEGQICKQARINLKDIEALLKTICIQNAPALL